MLLFIIVVIAAIAFEYINGFHDAANAIATVVSTKVLTPRQAIALAAFFNLTGALMGTAVASPQEFHLWWNESGAHYDMLANDVELDDLLRVIRSLEPVR